MLRLLKGKTLYVTLTMSKCYWLLYEIKNQRIGEFSINYQKDNWEHELLNEVLKIDSRITSLKITVESTLCRYILLPAQQKYPSEEVLNFLANLQFKKNYPSNNSDNFIFFFDKVNFNKNIFCKAIDKSVFQGILSLRQVIGNVSFTTSLGSICLFKKNESFIQYLEGNLIYCINQKKGDVEELNILPKSLNLKIGEKYTADNIILNLNLGNEKVDHYLNYIGVYCEKDIFY